MLHTVKSRSVMVGTTIRQGDGADVHAVEADRAEIEFDALGNGVGRAGHLGGGARYSARHRF